MSHTAPIGKQRSDKRDKGTEVAETVDQLHRAALIAAGYATDADELRVFLAMFGMVDGADR